MGDNKLPPKGAGGVTTQRPASQNKPQPATVGSGRVTLSKGKVKVGGGLLAQLKASKEPMSLEKIEERVFALPGMSDVKVPDVFKSFIEHIAPKLILPKTSYGILQAFSNIDVTAEKVAQCLKANPYYGFQFFKTIESMGKRENLPSTEGAVVLLGMQNSRNLVVALQLLRTVNQTHAEWTKEGKLKTQPSDIIKYALKTEELLAGKKSVYADTAYAAGLIFDVLTFIADTAVEDKKKMFAFIDAVYTHGLQSARIGAELAKNVPEFSFTKYIFSVCLLHDIGKIIMAILDANYIPFTEGLATKGLPRALRTYAEEKQFGVIHSLLSGLTCQYFKIFKPVEKAVLYHHEPFLIKLQNKNLYQLSSIVALASNMANNFKKVDKSDDPIIATWKSLEVKDFKIDARAMMSASLKAL